MARTPKSRGTEHPVPPEALRWMADGNQLDHPGVLLGRAPRRIAVRSDSEGREWDTDDPNREVEGGYYRVPAEALVEHHDHYDPDGILIWLPFEACFGAWDPDHWDVITFPGTTWADIVTDPRRYLAALEDGDPDLAYLIPIHTHPFVDEDGVAHPPIKPPAPPKPTPIGDAERALTAAATELLGDPAPDDPSDVTAALLAHGGGNESARADVLATLCAYVRHARPLPPPEAKRRPRPSAGVTAAMKAIGQCSGWGPIDLHGSHLHDLRFTGRAHDDRFEVAGDLDLHGCLFTGRTRWMWTWVQGRTRLDGVVADGEFDIANAVLVGPVTYSCSHFLGDHTAFGWHQADVDGSDIECAGITYLGQAYDGAADFDRAVFRRGFQASMRRVGGPFTMRRGLVPSATSSWFVRMWNVRFEGPVDLSGSTFSHFDLSGCRFEDALDLTEVTAIDWEVSFAKCRFADPVTMRGMVAPGPIDIEGATFAEPPDLTDGPELAGTPQIG